MLATSVVVIAAAVSGVMGITSIPTDISNSCRNFLGDLQTNQDLATCTTSLLSASSAFGSAATNASDSELDSTIEYLCDANANPCSDASIRSYLTGFWSACQNELAGLNEDDDVKQMYDALYAFQPMRSAICTKDTSTGDYCIYGVNGDNPRDYATEKSDTLDPSELRDAGIPFLFMLPDSKSDHLCTPCGKEVLAAYVSWESSQPHALGLGQSPILGGQTDLWSAVQKTCGSGFMNTIINGNNASAGGAPLAALGGGSDMSAQIRGFAAALVGVAVAGLAVAL